MAASTIPRRTAFWLRFSIAGLGFAAAVGWYIVIRILPGTNARRRESFARMMSRLCCLPAGVRVRVVNGERIEQHSPCVYASNHQSQIDYPIAGRIFPGNALVMASQIGDWPFLGYLYKTSGSIALDRDVPVRAASALDLAERSIREYRNSIWMFVEGTRGKIPGHMGKFRRGAFRLAATTGVPIVPIVISPLKPYTDLRGRRLSPHEVFIHVLEPIYAAGASAADEAALSAEVRSRMELVLSQYPIASF
jgi:putative phosphoserine phosphatase/1-acylglycerol-3-phosphate O-acyltransferase